MRKKLSQEALRPATLADVGKAAGVSAMAASAVLNGSRTSSRISEATRKRIIEAAAKLNYRANIAARALVNRRMDTLGVTVMVGGSELNLYFLEVFNGIIEAAGERNQNTTVFSVSHWNDIDEVVGFCDGRIDGMILVGPLFTKDVSERIPDTIPFVSLHSNHEVSKIVNLECDEEQGAYEMVSHLIKTGHQRIMHVSGCSDLLGVRRRIAGYQSAMLENGASSSDLRIVTSDFSPFEARRRLRVWLDEHERDDWPDAIFCVNDAAAMACVEVLGSYGLRVPEDVSVCGFDDSLVARSAHLSSVKQPLREMGQTAVRVLMDLIDGVLKGDPKQVKTPVLFKTSLALRNSILQR